MKGFLFDLDGTLVDTAIDMISALKELAHENNVFINPKYDQYKELITLGSKAIVTSIFGHLDDNQILILQKRYLEIYQQGLSNNSCLFEGVEDFIHHLDNNAIPWGIVTNKPAYLAKPLIASIDQLKNSRVLIGGDCTKHPKPHPEPINTAIKKTSIDPKKSWYIGDAKSDITAANLANMKSAVAMWGYLGKNDNPESWKANKLLNHTNELFDL